MGTPCKLCWGKGRIQRDPNAEEFKKFLRRSMGKLDKRKLLVTDFCSCKEGKRLRKAEFDEPKKGPANPDMGSRAGTSE